MYPRKFRDEDKAKQSRAQQQVQDYLATKNRNAYYQSCKSLPQGNVKGRNLAGRCSMPSFRGGVVEWHDSLLDIEDALDKRPYTLPRRALKQVKGLCKDKETIRDTVECVGDWVHEHFDYDELHATTSTRATEAIKFNFQNKNPKIENKEYPMHRYLNSYETWQSKSGICGELSQVAVAILRRKGIPAMIYRPFQSHISVIAEDPKKKEFYVYDATFPKRSCIFYGNPQKPARVVTKRFKPKHPYTYGVTPTSDFYDWTLKKRRILGTAKACQLLSGIHGKDNKRTGFYVNEEGKLDKSKLEGLGEEDSVRVERMFIECARYLDWVYEVSEYYDVVADTENLVLHPPREEFIREFTGEELLDLEHAYECQSLPYKTALGTLIETSLEEDCGRTKRTREKVVESIQDPEKEVRVQQWNRGLAESTGQEELFELQTDCSFEYGDITNEELEELISFEEPLEEEEETREERDKRLFYELGFVPEEDEDEWRKFA